MRVSKDHSGRRRALLEKRRLAAERRKEQEAAAALRQATRTRAMIANLELAISSLDASIEAELASARVRDPSHFGFPISARAMMARRENLTCTIAMLCKPLGDTDRVKQFAA
jgi:hypothetical protein